MRPILYFLSLLLTNTASPTATIIQNDTDSPKSGEIKWYSKEIINNTIKPSINNAMKYINYASAALCNDTSLKAWDCKPCKNVEGTQLVTIFNNFFSSTKGYIAINHYSQAIILTFRGTKSLINWGSNLELIQIPFGSVNGTGALVHIGFLGDMESVSGLFLDGLKSLLQNPLYSSYKIKIIGHSSAAAIASLATIKIKDKFDLPWNKLELYTYGQPRTGNVQFAEWFDTLPITVSRSVNYHDPVPRLPPLSLFNYAHHTNELFINGTSVTYCDSSVLEDPNCALSVPSKELNPNAHLSYYNVSFDVTDAC
ncbi:alpha/beta-hydrolase [Neoconidiobolus thromboides FSU 785]|nr:alpha/beta-hydrolase [Neoconidiobolus thromboides FSU 785]